MKKGDIVFPKPWHTTGSVLIGKVIKITDMGDCGGEFLVLKAKSNYKKIEGITRYFNPNNFMTKKLFEI